MRGQDTLHSLLYVGSDFWGILHVMIAEAVMTNIWCLAYFFPYKKSFHARSNIEVVSIAIVTFCGHLWLKVIVPIDVLRVQSQL